MNIADDLCTTTGHTYTNALLECPKPGQDDRVGEDLKEEVEEVKGSAYIGVVGDHVSSGRFYLS